MAIRIPVPISRLIDQATGFVSLDWLAFFTKLASQPQVYTVGALPGNARIGDVAYASDLRVFNGTGTKEGAGLGTGGFVTYNGSHWVVAGTNSVAVA